MPSPDQWAEKYVFFNNLTYFIDNNANYWNPIYN